MTTVPLSPEVRQGAQVTVAYCFLIIIALVRQGLTRSKYSDKAQKNKEKYVVADDERLYALSRTTGNLVEWSAPFLGLFWVAQLAAHGASTWFGWAYVAARVLYVVLASMGGIQLSGPAPFMAAATMPAYVALLGLLWKAAAAVVF